VPWPRESADTDFLHDLSERKEKNYEWGSDSNVVNKCSSGLAADASCSIVVTFTQTELGSRTGTLTIPDN
jgi:hypothetical protein